MTAIVVMFTLEEMPCHQERQAPLALNPVRNVGCNNDSLNIKEYQQH